MSQIVLLNDSNVVVNLVEASADFTVPAGLTIGTAGGKIGDTWNGSAYVPPVESGPTLNERKATKIRLAWNQCLQANEDGYVTVAVSAGSYPFGTDVVTQDNVTKVMVGVIAGVVPNPRPWTPKGALEPISVTHADIALIGAAMLSQVDANIQNYLTHKRNIMDLTAAADVTAYDITTGWL